MDAFFQRDPGAYEESLVPVMFAPLAERLLDAIDPRPGERALDLACGTGAVTRLLVPRLAPGGQATGLDLSAPMLAVARRRVPGAAFVEGDAQALPFEAAAFDLATCQQGLQFVPEPLLALRELRRVLVPGGRAGLAVWTAIDESPGFAVLAESVGRRLGPDARRVALTPYALPEAGVVAGLARRAGFAEVEVREDDGILEWASVELFVRRFGQGSVLSDVFAEAPDAALRVVVADVAAAFGLEPSAPLSFPRRSNLFLLR